MALIAPRGLMLSTATEEVASNPWGIEKALLSAQKAYEFLSAKDHIALRYRRGLHGTTAEDIEAYVDFFDYVFGRSAAGPKQKFSYDFSFAGWKKKSGESVNPMDYPDQTNTSVLNGKDGHTITTMEEWASQRKTILQKVDGVLGDKPAGVTNPGPQTMSKNVRGEDKFGSVI